MKPILAVAGLAADSPVLPDLISACAQRTALVFGYRKPGADGPEVRHVQPWGVVGWRGHWYLVGHDTDRDGQRVFRAWTSLPNTGRRGRRSRSNPARARPCVDVATEPDSWPTAGSS